MNPIFSDRISDVPKSFIREILKVAINEEVISFAGGLPNRELFPVDALREATMKVFDHNIRTALQYAGSEGSPELRAFISKRYKERCGLDIPVQNILITSGSQQGLDLLGKTFINEHDDVIIEEPGYLGAIQAFSVYKANFHSVPVNNEGMDVEKLAEVVRSTSPRLVYTVPDFQNPSGISYSNTNRMAVAEVLKDKNILIVEDDPYIELRYSGEPEKSFKEILPAQTILLGSFSKSVVPSFRLGWIVATDEIIDKLLVAKQASDLHSNYFSQCILTEYLKAGYFDAHVAEIKKVYNAQRLKMIKCIKKYFPSGIGYTEPEGGMFLWITLPEGLSSMELFDIAIKKKVAFVPGHPFYVGKSHTNTLRLNFSCVDEKGIEEGIRRLGASVEELLHTKQKSLSN